MSEFKAGDIVRLKRHEQDMVVQGQGQVLMLTGGAESIPLPVIICAWQDTLGVPHQAEYAPEALESAGEEEVVPGDKQFKF